MFDFEKIGSYLVINKVLNEYGIPELLGRHFDPKETGLFEDLMAYSLVCENNAAQYYPDYAFNHPLFTDDIHIYSDTKISEFLCGMTRDQSVGFLNDWNAACDHRQKIYVSYALRIKTARRKALNWLNNSAKSRRLQELVDMSYDLWAEGTDEDAVYLERAISREKDPELKRALEDLDEFLFGY